MNVNKVIKERIRQHVAGVDLDTDVNAVVAANVGKRGQTTSVSSTASAATGTSPKQESERREA